jgi:rhodanese-related sulfurtransferase
VQFDLLLQFLAEQWLLAGALVSTLSLLFYHETRKAGPAVSTQQAINLVNSEEGVFLDIRDVADFKKGHIADAINIPLASLQGRTGELESYREKPVIVVCRMGQTASGATKRLREQGFGRAQKMTGGMMEWNAQKLPVISG